MKKSPVLFMMLFTVSLLSSCDSDNSNNTRYLLLLVKTVLDGDVVWARSVTTGTVGSRFNSVAVGNDCTYSAGSIYGTGTYWFGAGIL